MITKKIIAPLIVVIILAGISGVFTAKKVSDSRINQTRAVTQDATDLEPNTETNAPSSSDGESQAAGKYAQYDEAAIRDTAYNQTILFFHAAWCPECRSFKKAINEAEIPNGTQVLEVNYDSASDLKKQYGVTLQSTFVKVDSSGNQQSKWVGYGKDKSLQVILQNL